jgi:3-oxoacyl-[acyl-carrier protein] reductase
MSKSRIIVVTGGGSGIGSAIASEFAMNGDTVYVLGRNKEKLDVVAKNNKNIIPITTDITKPTEVENAKKEITSQHNSVDVLVNCAGGNTKIDPNADLEEVVKGWNFIINVNLTGTFMMAHAFLPVITKPGGRIINITSLAALAGSSLGGVSGQAYSAAKSGVHGMTRTLAKAFAKEGVTINCVAPGVIDDTGFFGGEGVPDDRKDMYLANIPEGRLGKPDEVAAGVFYLASEKAGFITGEILNINGGGVFGR